MDATIIVFTILIGIIILLVVYSAKVATFYNKMVRRITLLPDMPPNAIKALFSAILGISLAWLISAVIKMDWWQIVVITLFILLTMFVLWKIETISEKKRKEGERQNKAKLDAIIKKLKITPEDISREMENHTKTEDTTANET